MKKTVKIPTPIRRIPGFSGLESTPGHYLILTPEFIILNASNVFLENTLTRRDDIIGRNIFDVFPGNPKDPASNGNSVLKESFVRVLERKMLDMTGVIKYDIPRPLSLGKGFEERFWNPVNFPIFDKQGSITHIIHNSEDVTSQVMQQRQ